MRLDADTFIRALEWANTERGRGALLYYAGYACLGLTLSQFGPVIIDLAATTGGSIRDVGLCLTARSFAYLIGAAGGNLFDRFPGHPILAFAMTLCCIGTVLIPFAKTTGALAAIVMLQGLAMGLLDTGCNLLMLWWYGDGAGPFMQALHCIFGIGATSGPLLLRIVESLGAVDSVNVAGGKTASAHAEGISTYAPAFYMTAVACGAVAIAFVFSVSPTARKAPEPAVDAAAAAKVEGAAVPDTPATAPLYFEAVSSDEIPGAASQGSPTKDVEAVVAVIAEPIVVAEAPTAPPPAGVSEQAAEATPGAAPAAVVAIDAIDAAASAQFERDKWVTVIVAAVLLGVYVGAETGYAAYVTAFSVIELGSTEARGQWLTSIFWAAITAGRFASIWLSAVLSPGTFLRLSMGVSALSSLILIGAARSEGGLWFFSIVFGLAMAPVFPTVLSLVESYFPVLGKYATVLMIGSAGGEMVIPAIIASSFGGAAEEATVADGAASGPAANPRALLYIVAAACSVNFGALFVLQRLGAQAARNHAALK